MVPRRIMRFRNDKESGHAILELAILAPMLMLLLFGMGDFARVFYAGIEVTNAAYAGAMYGVQTVGTAKKLDAIRTAAKNDASDLKAASLTVTPAQVCKCPDNSAGSCTGTCSGGGKLRLYVQVTATYPFQTLVKYPGVNKVTYQGYASTTTISKTVLLRVQ